MVINNGALIWPHMGKYEMNPYDSTSYHREGLGMSATFFIALHSYLDPIMENVALIPRPFLYMTHLIWSIKCYGDFEFFLVENPHFLDLCIKQFTVFVWSFWWWGRGQRWTDSEEKSKNTKNFNKLQFDCDVIDDVIIMSHTGNDSSSPEVCYLRQKYIFLNFWYHVIRLCHKRFVVWIIPYDWIIIFGQDIL